MNLFPKPPKNLTQHVEGSPLSAVLAAAAERNAAGPALPAVDLSAYRWVILNTSAGKDSQAMMDVLAGMVSAQGYDPARVVVVHCDLGRAEWAGTGSLASDHAAAYGFRFVKVARPKGDLVTRIEQRAASIAASNNPDRPAWPYAGGQYCTSELKTGQVGPLVTALTAEARAQGEAGTVKILSVLGIRAAESARRAKDAGFATPATCKALGSNTRRHVDRWYPIYRWTATQVKARNADAPTETHGAYSLGMPRLSCVFCVFAPKAALMIAGRENPELLETYIGLESVAGTFRNGFSLTEIRDALARGEEPGPVNTWEM
jgi:3'-phosphoadenosine 5'-phosphosulfate sulfotransferase (PAPS reductase)/FAD synthetase